MASVRGQAEELSVLIPERTSCKTSDLCFYSPLRPLLEVSLTSVKHYTVELMAFQCECEMKTFCNCSDLRRFP